jgi:hypothetical protein
MEPLNLNFDELELPEPRRIFARLIQPTSRAALEGKAKPGEFIVGEDVLKEIRGTVTNISPRRTLWKDGVVVCRSFDAKIGDGNPGGDCSVCPKAHGSPAECKMSYVVELATETGAVAVEFKTSSFDEFRKLISHLHRNREAEVTIASELPRKKSFYKLAVKVS